MKHRITISIDEETILKVRDRLRNNNLFRNKSHFVEYLLNNYLDKK